MAKVAWTDSAATQRPASELARIDLEDAPEGAALVIRQGQMELGVRFADGVSLVILGGQLIRRGREMMEARGESQDVALAELMGGYGRGGTGGARG